MCGLRTGVDLALRLGQDAADVAAESHVARVAEVT
jgi:hypothetical protein